MPCLLQAHPQLSGAEALAITVSLEAARRQELAVDGAAVAGALAKIERVLPEALRNELQSLRAAVASAPYAPTPQPASDVLRLVGAAIARHERPGCITPEPRALAAS